MAEISPQSQRPWQVLLVEDEPAVLQVLRGMLEHDGLTVTSVTSGEDALSRLRESAFDLLVTDKNLPATDGVELARWARDRHPGLGIVMITGYASLDSAQAMLGVVDQYITKPFDLRAFRKSLRLVLERRTWLSTQRRAARAHDVDRVRRKVLLVYTDDHQRARLSGLLEGLGLDVHEGRIADLEQAPDALVIDTAACDDEAEHTIWRQKTSDPDFPIIAVSRAPSIDGVMTAISLMARAHVLVSDSDEQISEVIRRGILGNEPASAGLSAAS